LVSCELYKALFLLDASHLTYLTTVFIYFLSSDFKPVLYSEHHRADEPRDTPDTHTHTLHINVPSCSITGNSTHRLHRLHSCGVCGMMCQNMKVYIVSIRFTLSSVCHHVFRLPDLAVDKQ